MNEICNPKNSAEALLKRIMNCFQEAGVDLESAAQLGPGLIAIPDSTGIMNLYYDKELWRLKNPEVWSASGTNEALALAEPLENVGYVPGMGFTSRPKTFVQATFVAGDVLASIELRFAKEPKVFS